MPISGDQIGLRCLATDSAELLQKQRSIGTVALSIAAMSAISGVGSSRSPLRRWRVGTSARKHRPLFPPLALS
eukprot:2815161-Alexandrium_andersonii.AAC.1